MRNMRDNPVVVGIAQGKAVTLPEKLITYALGSCVGVCLYDEKYRIAGMAHIMLPDAGLSLSQENPYKFADQGCRQLLKEMERLGASRCFITAKLAGGAARVASSWKYRGTQRKSGQSRLKGVECEDDGGGYREELRQNDHI